MPSRVDLDPAGGVPLATPALVALRATTPDPRQPRGRIHPLSAVLSPAVVALRAGMNSPEASAPFGRDHGAGLAHALGCRRTKTPAKSTPSEIFRASAPDTVEAVLRAWMPGRGVPGEAIARDGKALKGRRAGAVPGVHPPATFAPASAAVLGQVRGDAKANEHQAAPPAAGRRVRAGRGGQRRRQVHPPRRRPGGPRRRRR